MSVFEVVATGEEVGMVAVDSSDDETEKLDPASNAAAIAAAAADRPAGIRAARGAYPSALVGHAGDDAPAGSSERAGNGKRPGNGERPGAPRDAASSVHGKAGADSRLTVCVACSNSCAPIWSSRSDFWTLLTAPAGAPPTFPINSVRA